MTINEAIAFQNQLNHRIQELKALRNQVSTKESFYLAETRQRVIEPQYCVKRLDARIVQLQNWQFKLDATIKKVNAITEIGLNVPIDELLAPLE